MTDDAVIPANGRYGTRATRTPEASGQIFLVRHAETELDVQGRFRGRLDPSLSPRGLAMVETVALAFVHAPPTLVVASPQRAAMESAAAVAAHVRRSFSVDPRLDDIDYGAWTGLTLSEVRHRWPALFEEYMLDPARIRFPGGEQLVAAQTRAWAVVQELAERPDCPCAMLVTHDAIIRLIVCRLLGAPLSAIHRIAVGLASTTVIDVATGSPVLQWLNDSASRTCAGAQQHEPKGSS